MQAIAPVMGQRRTGQIDRAIEAATAAGAILGFRETEAHRHRSSSPAVPSWS
jgi:hypothetical protein